MPDLGLNVGAFAQRDRRAVAGIARAGTQYPAVRSLYENGSTNVTPVLAICRTLRVAKVR
jgi:hypothetical protein